MTKLIKKKDCKFKHCQIVKGDELIGIPFAVYHQLEKLELMAQQYMYLMGQGAYHPAPSLEGFKRQSMINDNIPFVEMPDTPVADARVREAEEFMREVDRVSSAADANEMLCRFRDLVLWCDNKKFVEGDCLYAIDTPQLGNPLKLTGENIADLLYLIASSPIVIKE